LVGGNCDLVTEPNEIVLTYWGLWESPEVIQPLIDKYEKENPHITINYQLREIDDYYKTLRSHLETDLAPDIVRVHNTWVPLLLANLSAIPDEVMTTSAYEQTFYPVTRETLLAKGKYYAVPLGIDNLALVYNTALYQQAGILKPPETWTEFNETAKILTHRDEDNEIIQAGAALGYSGGIEHFSDIVGLIMAQNGVDFIDKDGKVTLHKTFSQLSENLGADALRFYNLYATSRKTWNSSWPSALTSFAQSKTAMVFVPSFRIFDILALNPNLPLAVAPIPQLDPTSANINWATYWVETVPKNSLHQKEAWQFLKFLTEKENLAEFYSLASSTRLFGEAYPRPDMAEELINHRYLGPYISQASTCTTWNLADGTHDIYLNDEIKEIFGSLIDKINIDISELEEKLDEAAEEVQKVLDEAK